MLPLAMIVMVVGLLVVSPFLSNASTHMLVERETTRYARDYYAADAGLEYALAALKRNAPDAGTGVRDQSLLSYPNSYQLSSGPPPVNSLSPTVSAKLLNPASWDVTDVRRSRLQAGLPLGFSLFGGSVEAAPLFAPDEAFWSFEGGTDQGWAKYNNEGTSVNSVANSTAAAYAGTRSLEVNVNLQNQNSTGAVAVNTTVITGTITARVLAPSNPVAIQARIFVYDTADVAHYGTWSSSLSEGQWVTLTYDMSGVTWSPKTLGVGFKRGAGARFNGNLYLDSVDFSHPTVSLSKSVSTSLVTAGDPVTYTITLTNTGASTAYPTTITDTMPSGFQYVSGSTMINGGSAANPSGSGQTLTWSSLPSVGASATLTLSFRASTASSVGTYYNSAGVSGSNFNSTAVSNVAPVTTVVPGVGLAIAASSYTLNLGDLLTYTVTISNTGLGSASLGTLQADLPGGFVYTTSSSTFGGSPFSDPAINGGRATWNLSNSLGASQTITLAFVVTVDYDSANPGSYGTPAMLSGANFSDVQADLPQAIVVVDPQSGALIVVDPTRGPPGFSITISGSGFRQGQPVTLNWDGASFGSATPSSQGQFVVTTTVPSSGAGAYWGNHSLTGVERRTTAAASFRVEAKYRIESQANGTSLLALVGLHGPTSGSATADPTLTVYLWKQQ